MLLKFARVSLLVLLFFPLFSADRPLAAQSANPVRPAVLAFEVDMGKLKNSPLGPMIQQMEDAPVQSGPQSIFATAKSMSGSMSLPASAQDLMTMGPQEPIPFDFVVRVDFADQAALSKVWEQISADFEPAEEGGVKGYRLASNETPNMLFTKTDDDSMAFGTPGFLKQSSRDSNGRGVSELISSLPKHSLKVALDLSNTEDLFDEVKEMLDGQLPPEAAPFFEVLMKIESLKLSADMEDEKLLVLGIRGRDEEGTKEIFSTLDGLLNLGKFAGGAQIAQMKESAPEMAKVLSTLLTSLKLKNEGNAMTMEVPRPEGMTEAMREGINAAKAQAEAAQDMNRFKQTALAMWSYESAYQVLPFAAGDGDKTTTGALSWRVKVLPFIDESELHKQIDLKDDWDSSANKAFGEKMPAVYGTDSDSMSDIAYIETDPVVKKVTDVTDGTSNTIAFIKLKAGQPWMNPKNLSPDDAVKLYAGLKDGESLITAFYDGSVRRIAKGEMSEEEFRSALLPNDGK